MNQEDKTIQTPSTDDVELNKRMAEFISRYGELVKFYNIDFAAYPVWMPDDNGAFKTIIKMTPVDISKFQKKDEGFVPGTSATPDVQTNKESSPAK